MRIRLALISCDKDYLDRLSNALRKEYSSQVEIYTFSDVSLAMETMRNTRIDVALLDSDFSKQTENVVAGSVAVFVESQTVMELNGKKAICKYQSVESLFKQVLGLYADQVSSVIKTQNNQNTKIIGFTSAAGGVGVSTVSVACAKALSNRQKRVLYMSLDEYGDTGFVFRNEVQNGGLYEVIRAIKSKKTNLALKIESLVTKDESGVEYLASTPQALMMTEFLDEELETLIREVLSNGSFDYVIIDYHLTMSTRSDILMKMSNETILVLDGHDFSNRKFERMLQSLLIKEQNDVALAHARKSILYNRCSNKDSTGFAGLEYEVITGFPPFERASTEDVICTICRDEKLVQHLTNM